MQSEKSSKKLLICEILHFSTFPRMLASGSQKRLANLTATKIPHEIITKTKFIYLKTYGRKTALKVIISKICVLRNFAFYNFFRILVFSPQKRVEQFCSCSNITQYHCNVKTSQKTCSWNITWNHYNIKVCKRDYSQGYYQKIYYLAKFRILQLLLESWYSALRRVLANFTPPLISRSIVTMSKLHRKLAVTAMFRKFSILQNFAFYNFWQNLGF